MRRLKNISTYFIIVALTTMVSCGQNEGKQKNEKSIDNSTTALVSKDSVIKNGNVTMTISTDIEKLGQILDFKTYKPTKVKFKYTFIDNRVLNVLKRKGSFLTQSYL